MRWCPSCGELLEDCFCGFELEEDENDLLESSRTDDLEEEEDLSRPFWWEEPDA